MNSIVGHLDSIICGDNVEVMATFPDACIDLVVTSPPYDNLRNYLFANAVVSWDFPSVARELTRILKPGGVIVWVVGDATVDGSETLTSMKQAIHFREVCGLNVHDTMIYQKAGGGAVGSDKAYWQCWEYMLILSKGQPNSVHRLKEKAMHPGNRHTPSNKAKSVQKTRLTASTTTTGDMVVRQNVWRYGTNPAQMGKTEHPAPFPENLASDHILSWSNPGDVVLDPFAGSGTTLKMAKEHWRHYVGIEVCPEYVAICEKRVAQGVLPLVLHAPDCAIALNGRHACSCMPTPEEGG